MLMFRAFVWYVLSVVDVRVLKVYRLAPLMHSCVYVCGLFTCVCECVSVCNWVCMYGRDVSVEHTLVLCVFCALRCESGCVHVFVCLSTIESRGVRCSRCSRAALSSHLPEAKWIQ